MIKQHKILAWALQIVKAMKRSFQLKILSILSYNHITIVRQNIKIVIQGSEVKYYGLQMILPTAQIVCSYYFILCNKKLYPSLQQQYINSYSRRIQKYLIQIAQTSFNYPSLQSLIYQTKNAIFQQLILPYSIMITIISFKQQIVLSGAEKNKHRQVIIFYSMKKDLKNYKTSLCWHYTNKGNCSLFEKCYFAHGQKELRQKADPVPPTVPPQFQLVSIYKTQLCKYFMKGYCRNDTECPFAHGSRDLHGMLIASSAPVRPDYGQAGQFLMSILKNLEQVFPEEVAKRVLIRKGIELVETGELPEANEIINELVSSNTLTERQKEQCQTILSNAYSLHKINFMQF